MGNKICLYSAPDNYFADDNSTSTVLMITQLNQYSTHDNSAQPVQYS